MTPDALRAITGYGRCGELTQTSLRFDRDDSDVTSGVCVVDDGQFVTMRMVALAGGLLVSTFAPLVIALHLLLQPPLLWVLRNNGHSAIVDVAYCRLLWLVVLA